MRINPEYDNKGRVIRGVKTGIELKGEENEIMIEELFSQYFGITFSKLTSFKNSRYVFSFLQPGEEFLNNFNMYNEVLLLFSKYSNFDERIFDYIDKLQGEFDNRIDKVCTILVSSDKKIQSKIKKINSSRKDSKIIVPFTYDEFNNGLSSHDLNNRLREFFYSRDLFALESPITNNAYFFGRTQVVNDLYSNYRHGEQSGLFGLRKIGKTSVLYALKRLIDVHKEVAIYIDCQSPSVHLLNWNEFLHLILKKIKEEYSLNTTIPSEDIFTQKKAAQVFNNTIIEMNKELGCRILLIFDEIESISIDTSPSEHWNKGTDFLYFWQTIRALVQENQNVISFLLAGVNPNCVEKIDVNGFDNPIYSICQPLYLELFNYEEVKEMLSSIGRYMGLTYEEQIFSSLMNDYGGHPFLVRHVCSILNNDAGSYRPVEIINLDYLNNQEKINDEMNKYIAQIVSVLEKYYPDEYDLLKLLSLDGNQAFVDKVGNNYNYISHLQGYSIIRKHRQQFHVSLNSLTTFMNRKYNLTPRNDFEKRISVISLRRNRLEKTLKDYIIKVFHTSFGDKKIKDSILACKETAIRERLRNTPLSDILENELFFLDLKTLITKNWGLFEKVFPDKTKFIMYMDVINSFRIDAHAKNIKEEEYNFLLLSLSQIEQCIEMT